MSRPDLIVPIRDRRQHRRILTLKNFGRAMIVLFAFFIGLTLESNLRHPKSGGDYGRLFGKQVSGQTVVTPKYDVVKETPVDDQTAADPLLVDAQRREQWLSVTNTTATADPQTNTGIVVTRSAPQPSQPLLSGGIFRQ